MLTAYKAVSNIYVRPPKKDENTPLSDEILCGWQVEVLEKEGEICRVRTEYGYEGYMYLSDLCYRSDIPDGEEYQVSARFCDILPLAEYDLPPFITLSKMSVIRLLEKGEKWSKVELPDGRCGFVRTLLISPKNKIFARHGYADTIPDSDELRAQVIRNAEKYLGTPYRWGGKSCFGIDCSGLTFLAYYECGINIYRDAEYEIDKTYNIEYTKSIPLEEARPGDLLYFPGHIGMFIEGKRFMHAAGSVNAITAYNSLDPNDDDFCEDLRDSFITAATVFTKRD